MQLNQKRMSPATELIYHEDVSKTNQGGLKSRKFRPKRITHWPRSDKPERRVISLFKKYNSLCPEDRPDDAFYLKPLPVPRANQWYSKAPIGQNIISNIVARLCQKGRNRWPSNRPFSESYSGYKTIPSGVDEQLIMEQTGHRSVQCVRSYIKGQVQNSKSLSDVLSGNTVSTCCSSSIKINPLQSLKGFTFNNCSNIQINIQLPQKSAQSSIISIIFLHLLLLLALYRLLKLVMYLFYCYSVLLPSTSKKIINLCQKHL